MQVELVVGAAGFASLVPAFVWLLVRAARTLVSVGRWKTWDVTLRRAGVSKAARRQLLIEAARAEVESVRVVYR